MGSVECVVTGVFNEDFYEQWDGEMKRWREIAGLDAEIKRQVGFEEAVAQQLAPFGELILSHAFGFGDSRPGRAQCIDGGAFGLEA